LALTWVEALIKAAEDHETLAIWREAVTPTVGTSQHTVDNDNIMKPEEGDSRSYGVSRLKRERPELFADVVAGKLSANAAAIKAGFAASRIPTQQSF
jgi:hypothetical protein